MPPGGPGRCPVNKTIVIKGCNTSLSPPFLFVMFPRIVHLSPQVWRGEFVLLVESVVNIWMLPRAFGRSPLLRQQADPALPSLRVAINEFRKSNFQGAALVEGRMMMLTDLVDLAVRSTEVASLKQLFFSMSRGVPRDATRKARWSLVDRSRARLVTRIVELHAADSQGWTALAQQLLAIGSPADVELHPVGGSKRSVNAVDAAIQAAELQPEKRFTWRLLHAAMKKQGITTVAVGSNTMSLAAVHQRASKSGTTAREKKPGRRTQDLLTLVSEGATNGQRAAAWLRLGRSINGTLLIGTRRYTPADCFIHALQHDGKNAVAWRALLRTFRRPVGLPLSACLAAGSDRFVLTSPCVKMHDDVLSPIGVAAKGVAQCPEDELMWLALAEMLAVSRIAGGFDVTHPDAVIPDSASGEPASVTCRAALEKAVELCEAKGPVAPAVLFGVARVLLAVGAAAADPPTVSIGGTPTSALEAATRAATGSPHNPSYWLLLADAVARNTGSVVEVGDKKFDELGCLAIAADISRWPSLVARVATLMERQSKENEAGSEEGSSSPNKPTVTLWGKTFTADELRQATPPH